MSQYYKYRASEPNGMLREFRCPTFFTPVEVAKRLEPSDIFMCVPNRSRMLTETGEVVKGPCWVLLMGETCRKTPMPTAETAHKIIMDTWHASDAYKKAT
jgi:hypothetical protein